MRKRGPAQADDNAVDDDAADDDAADDNAADDDAADDNAADDDAADEQRWGIRCSRHSEMVSRASWHLGQ